MRHNSRILWLKIEALPANVGSVQRVNNRLALFERFDAEHESPDLQFLIKMAILLR